MNSQNNEIDFDSLFTVNADIKKHIIENINLELNDRLNKCEALVEEKIDNVEGDAIEGDADKGDKLVSIVGKVQYPQEVPELVVAILNSDLLLLNKVDAIWEVIKDSSELSSWVTVPNKSGKPPIALKEFREIKKQLKEQLLAQCESETVIENEAVENEAVENEVVESDIFDEGFDEDFEKPVRVIVNNRLSFLWFEKLICNMNGYSLYLRKYTQSRNCLPPNIPGVYLQNNNTNLEDGVDLCLQLNFEQFYILVGMIDSLNSSGKLKHIAKQILKLCEQAESQKS